MILIGQYDSPFVRRVGIALTLQGLAFEQWPWSIFADAEKLQRYNPLIRVPTLLLDDGEALIESHAILDYLDGLVPPERRLFPQAEPERRKAFKVAALATGLGDKAVSLFYEQRLHGQVSEVWVARCHAQIAAVLHTLETARASRQGDYWFGEGLTHADIAVAVVLRFLAEVHPALWSAAAHPALAAQATRLEALPAFQAIRQPFVSPA